MDLVVIDLMPGWCDWYERVFGDFITPEDIITYDMTDHVDACCGEKIYDYLKREDTYGQVLRSVPDYISGTNISQGNYLVHQENSPPVKGAIEGIHALRAAGHRVVFVTSTNLYQNGKKLLWLVRHGLLVLDKSGSSDYIEARDKSLIMADVIIDDSPNHLATSPCSTKIMFRAPHNYDNWDFTWCDGWPSVVEHIKCIDSYVNKGEKTSWHYLTK